MVAQLLLRQRQVVLARGVTVHVLAGDLEDAHCHQVGLLHVAFDLFDGLPDNELRWIVIHHFLVGAHHVDSLVAIEICWIGSFARLDPFRSQTCALFMESWQVAQNLGQNGDVVLGLHILVRSKSLALLDEIVALLRAERLEPVAIARVLIGRRGQIVDILTDLLILNTHADKLEKGVDCVLNARLLCFPHIC